MPRMETSITHASMPRKGCLSMLFGPILCSDSRERSSVAKVGIAVLMLEPAVGCWDYWTMTIYSPSNSICISSSSSSSSPFFPDACLLFWGQEWLIALIELSLRGNECRNEDSGNERKEKGTTWRRKQQNTEWEERREAGMMFERSSWRHTWSECHDNVIALALAKYHLIYTMNNLIWI